MQFKICGSVGTLKNLSVWIGNQILMFQRLLITKIKCNSNRTTISFFFEQLQMVMSIIKHVSLHIYVDINDEILLERLTND
jgi:hypothetical protein